MVDVRLNLAPHKVTVWIRKDGNGVTGLDWADLEGATLSRCSRRTVDPLAAALRPLPLPFTG